MAEKTAPKIRVKLAHGATPINEGGVVNIGAHPPITLPGLDEQKAGFDLPVAEAKRLLTQYPDRYKRMETTGVSQQAQQQEGQNQQQQSGQQGEGQQQSSDDIRDKDASSEDEADNTDAEGQQDEDVTNEEGQEDATED